LVPPPSGDSVCRSSSCGQGGLSREEAAPGFRGGSAPPLRSSSKCCYSRQPNGSLQRSLREGCVRFRVRAQNRASRLPEGMGSRDGRDFVVGRDPRAEGVPCVPSLGDREPHSLRSFPMGHGTLCSGSTAGRSMAGSSAHASSVSFLIWPSARMIRLGSRPIRSACMNALHGA
jgi:hypothetical protein